MSATRFSFCVVPAVMLIGVAGVAGATTLKVERSRTGLRVLADDARLESVLDALAETEHFDIVMQLGIERRPVDVDLRDVSLEQALRSILRRRNYSISYQHTDDGLAVSRVDVLLPEDVVSAAAASSRAAAAAEQRRSGIQQQIRMRAERERQRALQMENARAAQRRREAQQANSVPLRRLLWGRATARR